MSIHVYNKTKWNKQYGQRVHRNKNIALVVLQAKNSSRKTHKNNKIKFSSYFFRFKYKKQTYELVICFYHNVCLTATTITTTTYGALSPHPLSECCDLLQLVQSYSFEFIRTNTTQSEFFLPPFRSNGFSS